MNNHLVFIAAAGPNGKFIGFIGEDGFAWLVDGDKDILYGSGGER